MLDFSPSQTSQGSSGKQDGPLVGRVISVSTWNPEWWECRQLDGGIEGMLWEWGSHAGRIGDSPGETWQ